MTEEVKKTARTKPSTSAVAPIKVADVLTPPLLTAFSDLINKVNQSRVEFEALQEEIEQVKKAWLKEREDHRLEIEERTRREEREKREQQEAYTYETLRARKKTEDEFVDKKVAWEKQLRDEREIIEKERQELIELRKLTANFATEKDKAIKEAEVILQKQLTNQFGVDTRLREQEIKAQIDLLNLQIASLAAENTKQTKEIEALKRALDEATKQVKDVALKVIEFHRPLDVSQSST